MLGIKRELGLNKYTIACFLNFQWLAQVAYFLKKYGERPENAKEGEAVDNNMKDGQMVKEEEKEVEEKVEEADKEEDEMVEKMIGDYGPQQKVFRKMRSNPPSTA